MNIYRAIVGVVATVSIDEKTVLQTKIMNEDIIVSEFVTAAVLPIAIGDYVTYNGQNYWMNSLPSIIKKSDNTYKYSVVFQSELYDLNQKLLISSDGLADFSYAATPLEALTLIITNMNSTSAGWIMGDVDDAEVVILEFFNETCRAALTVIADAFAFEFEVIEKTINFKKSIGTVKDYTFEYGRGQGLYEVERRQVENKTVFTRVYGFGGTKNIPYTYRDHAKRLVFQERFLDKNVDIYGIKEGQFTDETIYPKRTGTLTAVNPIFSDTDVFNVLESYVTDTSLDFDINDYLLEGLTAKIVFKSGALSGYQFEIWKYEEATKRIYFNPYNESDGYVLPSITSLPAIGDTYTLVDIEMPGIYIIQAENALRAATQRYIDENAVPKVIYIVKIDPKYAKEQAVAIGAGDLVKIVDAQLGIDRSIRIAQISYPIVNPFKMTAIIADYIPYNLQQFQNRRLGSTDRSIRNIVNRITNINNSTTNNQTINNYNPEYPEDNVVVINGRRFRYTKAIYNALNPSVFEFGDYLYDNFWDDDTYVVNWQFLGIDKSVRQNYTEIESIDCTDLTRMSVLNKLKVKQLNEVGSPAFLATVDALGVFGRTPYVQSNFRGGRAIDGGASRTVYLNTQNIEGGSVISIPSGTINGGNAQNN